MSPPGERSAEGAVGVVLITAPDAETGARLARQLVEERLVACVNLVPGLRSIYRWQGELQEDAEVLLVAKCARARAAEVAARVKDLHPYELPEVLVLPVEGGSEAYLSWVVTESSG